ncbi:hypothetical protein FRC02_004869 [Tulasnella sp. 418]|nr:hypothetical protein FRC02_004869 [Tulasnella sp. 418]
MVAQYNSERKVSTVGRSHKSAGGATKLRLLSPGKENIPPHRLALNRERRVTSIRSMAYSSVTTATVYDSVL